MPPTKEYPYEIKKVKNDENKIITKCLIAFFYWIINGEGCFIIGGYTKPFIRCGPSGYIMPDSFKKHANALYNFNVRPDDVWVVTFPRSGTTWMQELIWLACNDLNFKYAKDVPLHERFPMLELTSQIPEIGFNLIKLNFMNLGNFQGLGQAVREPSWETLDNAPSPRYIKTHMPLSLLPPNLLRTAKVIYVARDPRDVAVSYYYLHKLVANKLLRASFKDFWEAFRKDLLPWGPVISHANEAWVQRHHPNLHFVFYEDLIQDLKTEIRKICQFLNKEFSDIEIKDLAEHLSFDNLKKNKKVNNTTTMTAPEEQSDIQFIRKGQVGDWVKHFDAQMTKEADEFLARRLQKLDLVYPTILGEDTNECSYL